MKIDLLVFSNGHVVLSFYDPVDASFPYFRSNENPVSLTPLFDYTPNIWFNFSPKKVYPLQVMNFWVTLNSCHLLVSALTASAACVCYSACLCCRWTARTSVVLHIRKPSWRSSLPLTRSCSTSATTRHLPDCGSVPCLSLTNFLPKMKNKWTRKRISACQKFVKLVEVSSFISSILHSDCVFEPFWTSWLRERVNSSFVQKLTGHSCCRRWSCSRRRERGWVSVSREEHVVCPVTRWTTRTRVSSFHR